VPDLVTDGMLRDWAIERLQESEQSKSREIAPRTEYGDGQDVNLSIMLAQSGVGSN
jgi:hypothetical protein